MVTHVTALVVTYQRPPILATALNAIQGQTRRPDEIVVVDNDPAGSARAVADRAGVTYVAAGVNGGYASGIAVGMEHMAGSTDVFWILDDDTYPAADALALMLEHLWSAIAAGTSVEAAFATTFAIHAPASWPTPTSHSSTVRSSGQTRSPLQALFAATSS